MNNCKGCGKAITGRRKCCDKYCASVVGNRANAKKRYENALLNFKNKTIVDGTCLFWTAQRDKDGYGRVRYKSKNWLAHRLSYLLHFDIDPGKLIVLHKCDRPPCVNPAGFIICPYKKDKDHYGKVDAQSKRNHWSCSLCDGNKILREESWDDFFALKKSIWRKKGWYAAPKDGYSKPFDGWYAVSGELLYAAIADFGHHQQGVKIEEVKENQAFGVDDVLFFFHGQQIMVPSDFSKFQEDLKNRDIKIRTAYTESRVNVLIQEKEKALLFTKKFFGM